MDNLIHLATWRQDYCRSLLLGNQWSVEDLAKRQAERVGGRGKEEGVNGGEGRSEEGEGGKGGRERGGGRGRREEGIRGRGEERGRDKRERGERRSKWGRGEE